MADIGVLNSEKDDFLTISEDVSNPEGFYDTKVEKLEHLVVSSYAEVEQKFVPVVFSFFDAVREEPVYTLERPAPSVVPPEYVREIPLMMNNLTDDILYSMLDRRFAVDVKNVAFRHDSDLQKLMPKKIALRVKQIRKELLHNSTKYEALPDDAPVKDDIGDTLNNLMAEAKEYFDNGGLLCLR